MKWFFIFCSILVLSGCCGNEVVFRNLAVEVPGRVDTIKSQEFMIKVEDDEEEIRYSGISLKDGSKKDTAILAVFIPTKKQFIIKRFPVKDTVYVIDTLRVKPTDVLIRGNDNTERLIWIISFALTSIIIIGYKGYLNDRKSKKQA